MEISVTGGTYYPDELPDEITDDGEYTISGTGTKTITISGSPKITLKDVNIAADTSCIHIKEGNPTITLEGSNKLKLPEELALFANPPLWLDGENAHVTIQGDGTLEVDATVKGSWCTPAIGSLKGKCGNITILGGTIKAYASTSAGIGSGVRSECGKITIKNATVDVKGNPAIGAGNSSIDEKSSCGDILIENTDLTANVFDENGGVSCVDIGCGGSNDGGTITCGTITINNNGKTRAQILEGLKDGNPLIGKGSNLKGTSSCGLITITGSDGTQTYSGDTGVTNN